MTKFKIGDRVRIKTSGLTGVIKAIFDPDYWNMSGTEYSIELDNGSGAVTIVEKVLERLDPEPTCECGLKHVRHGGKHSSWCPLFEPDE